MGNRRGMYYITWAELARARRHPGCSHPLLDYCPSTQGTYIRAVARVPASVANGSAESRRAPDHWPGSGDSASRSVARRRRRATGRASDGVRPAHGYRPDRAVRPLHRHPIFAAEGLARHEREGLFPQRMEAVGEPNLRCFNDTGSIGLP